MAARVHKIRHDDETRSRIKVGNIITRLEGHISGEIDMPASAVTAALGLLRKVLPDLSESKDTLEVEHRYVIELPALPADTDQWQQQYAPKEITKSPGAPNGHNSH